MPDSNYIKRLSITASPISHTEQSTTWAPWDNSSHGMDLISNGSSVQPDLNIFMPETEYSVSASGIDSYDNAIDISFTENITNFTTKNDYPTFSDVYIGSLNPIDNEYYFTYVNNNDTIPYIESVASSIKTPKIFPNSSNSNPSSKKDFLNETNYINTTNFIARGLIDFTDKNITDPITIYSGDWKDADFYSEFYFNNYYYVEDSNYQNPPKNIISNKSNTIISFDSFNSKLGLYKITASSSALGLNSSLTFTGSIDNKGEDVQTYYLRNTKHGTISQLFSGSDIGSNPNIIDFTSETNLYACKEDEKNHVFIGIIENSINEETHNDYEYNESNIEISINSTSKCRKGSTLSDKEFNASKSSLTIPFKTYFKPKINLYRQENSGEPFIIGTPLLDGNIKFSDSNISSYTSIKFIGNDKFDEYLGYSVEANYRTFIDITTNIYRPFLPLFNYNFEGPIIGTEINDIFDNYIDDSYYFGSDSVSRKNLNSHYRLTPFIIEALYIEDGDEPVKDLYEYRLSGLNSSSIEFSNPDITYQISDFIPENSIWNAIGATPTEDEGQLNLYKDYYNDNYDYRLNREDLRNPSTKVYNSAQPAKISWPIGYARMNGLTYPAYSPFDGTATGLIPDTYYFFRATAANFCGTTSKIFAIKTLKPINNYFNTHISIVHSDGSNPILVNGSTISDTAYEVDWTDAEHVLNLESGKYIRIYGTTTGGYGWDHYTGLETEKQECTVWYKYRANSESDWSNEIRISTSGAGAGIAGMWDYFYTDQFPYNNNGLPAGQYMIIVKSDTFHYSNSPDPWGYQMVHKYLINVTDYNTLNVITGDVEVTSTSTATINGSYTKTGDHTIEHTGFAYRESGSTEWTLVTATDNSGSFSYNLTGLTQNTGYEYKARARSSDSEIGTVEGEIKRFTTPNIVNANILINNPTRTGVSIIVS